MGDPAYSFMNMTVSSSGAISALPVASGAVVTKNTMMNNNKVKVVAGYALQQKLGSGSFAVVYKGVRMPQQQQQQQQGPAPETAETVAIKAIIRTSEKLTKKVLQNLEVEIKILRTYRHRNIVCMHDVQKTERHFYLVLEYCGGGDVQKLIRTRRAGRLTEGLTRRLMRDLASGLKFLRGQELIHRDIKPQNLLLTGPLPMDEMNDPEKTDELEQMRRDANYPSNDFVLKIADFGFARHLQTASLAETLCGSPLYMAPEILQHHRYDAKADLWSVGTVLFEMITGRPPFHGENHMDLLRNIQRKAVRLPPDVQVSKECVTLLRMLLNRNHLTRAGFDEFFTACDAFVALGCNGVCTPEDEGICHRPSLDLGTIPENEGMSESESIPNLPTMPQQQQQSPVNAPAVTPYLGPDPSPSIPIGPAAGQTSAHHNNIAQITSHRHTLTPLIPSPPATSASPIASTVAGIQMNTIDTRHQQTSGYVPSTWPQQQQQQQPETPTSSEENSFVMVEHGSSLHRTSPSTSTVAVVPSSGTNLEQYRQNNAYAQAAPQRLDSSPPSSPAGFFLSRNPVLTPRGDYMVVKQPKGMLSTSPGTGGALMGLLSGRVRLVQEDANDSAKQLESRIKVATKMIAASEDVGRRAISVAHLGDQRAYAAMRLVLVNESASSSLISTTPMDDIEEEADGAVTDDGSSTTEIMSYVRRRRSSSATDKSMHDANKPLVDDDADEMPFAVSGESPPVFSTGLPVREAVTTGTKGTTITSSKHSSRPTPVIIRSNFSEALSCYLKALKMVKGAIAAAKRVFNELDSLSGLRLNSEQLEYLQKMKKRCEGTTTWLCGQFQCILERADATNNEIGKLPAALQIMSEHRAEVAAPVTAEELIYNHALGCGREGAVKQLLGQFEQARSCYRTAGLLAETLLMESGMGNDDRKILEEYVDGFAARITELDEVMLKQSRFAGSSATESMGSSRRGPSVVGLVGHPLAPPNLTAMHPVGR